MLQAQTRGLGGRGRDRRLLRGGSSGRPARDRERRPRPDPAGARPGRQAPVHGPRRERARRVRRGGRAREVRRAGLALRGVRDPARRSLRRAPRRARASARRRRARWSRPTARSRSCWRTPRRRAAARAAQGQARAPSSAARSPPTTSRRCSSWSRSTRIAPLERWAGERDDEALPRSPTSSPSRVPCSGCSPRWTPPPRADPRTLGFSTFHLDVTASAPGPRRSRRSPPRSSGLRSTFLGSTIPL